ncbi:class I SAM-dependent methyltransferase [Dyadobacter sediminis]|uniref:class I SAM-dependent methyltransferase n=1 Tax=Dyadobacter sediminis TaxID=1493691 RepID=UPI0019890377|nr:class I SAM-dependent methyltransferase [Dyadobacter sediminis]GGB91275.1 hypothetical protein GCM10011325_18390 [Dyadobacter sediminis]
MITNNYDDIAGNYDAISRLVFRKSIVRSQQVLLPHVKTPSRILIVGGGTGWILEELSRIHPRGLSITYVEISRNMIALAEKRNWQQNRVSFVHTAIEDYDTEIKFDVIMTPFLFDNFRTERAETVFRLLDKLVLPGGLWLFTDFHVEKNARGIWQLVLLKIMYWFFRKIAHVEAGELPNLDAQFLAARYACIYKSFHFSRFIQSLVFRKLI